VRISKGEDDGVLKIAGDVRIPAVEELHTVLRDFVRTAPSPTVDLSGVETCDTAMLQLLSSARKTAEQVSRPLEYVGLSDQILDACALLGLSLTPVHPDVRGVEDAAI